MSDTPRILYFPLFLLSLHYALLQHQPLLNYCFSGKVSPHLVLCQKPIAKKKSAGGVCSLRWFPWKGHWRGLGALPTRLLHSQYSTFMAANTTLEHKSKRQVSDKTTSRLITAECYQDNSIENPLKQEQNSGHFLAKLITNYYY